MNYKTRNLIDHMWGPIVGVVLNVIIVFVLLVYVHMGGAEETVLKKVKTIEQREVEEIEDIEEELFDEPEEIEEFTEDLEFSLDDPLETEFTQDAEAVDTSVSMDMADLSDLMSDLDSPVEMSGLLQGRSQMGRKSALSRYGGGLGGKTEPAAMRALRWLKDHQKPSGAWALDGEFKTEGKKNTGATGLALLAFLAHGETPESVEFGDTVTRGLKFLMAAQKSDGKMTMGDNHQSYGHAIATYALAEAFNMTELPQLKRAMEKGIDVILQGQQKNGGYFYKYDTAPDAKNDSSVAAWQIQAMKAAYLAGANNSGLKAKMLKGIDGMLDNSAKVDGGGLGIGYTDPGKKPTISAAGLLCLQLTGQKKANSARALLKFIEPMQPGSFDEKFNPGYGGWVYLWYYLAQAKFQADAGTDGKMFATFNPLAAQYLLKTQRKDGSWEEEQHPRPVVDTSLAALTLMVYYRHLPSTQAVDNKEMDDGGDLEEEDAVEFIL